MRALAFALGVALLAVPSAAAAGPGGKLLYVHGKRALIVYVGSPLRQPIALKETGVPHWSGDGRLISVGGLVVGRAHLPTREVVWAPTGELAAYVTKAGGVFLWSSGRAREQVVPDGWGAQTLAWSRGGSLALGRAVCRGACGRPSHKEIWIWRRGSPLRPIVGALPGDQTPMPFAWWRGRVLWWDWPGSGSIAADGVALYENRRRIATTLMYRDYAAVCGDHLAVAAGGDRYAMHGKRILFDGRDVSQDPSRSWVSPSCLSDGTLVAAASRNAVPNRIGREARSIWRLLPKREQLTDPPSGWTDETPTLLPDGSVVFVRTRQISRRADGSWVTTSRGRIELLRGRKLTELTSVQWSAADTSGDFLNYYGHYDWPSRLAVWP